MALLNEKNSIANLVKVLNNLKQKAFHEGSNRKVIQLREIPETFKFGHYAELGIMAVLGRINSFYKEFYNINLYVMISYEKDFTTAVDLSILGRDINIKSRFSHQSGDIKDDTDDNIQIIYDYPGFYNLSKLLLRLDELHYIPNNIVKDVNYIWELYMTFSIGRSNQIVYRNLNGNELDSFDTYVHDFPLNVKRSVKDEYNKYKSLNLEKKRKPKSNIADEMKTISLRDASELLGLGGDAVRKYLIDGKIKGYMNTTNNHKLKTWRVNLSSIYQFQEELSEESQKYTEKLKFSEFLSISDLCQKYDLPLMNKLYHLIHTNQIEFRKTDGNYEINIASFEQYLNTYTLK